MASNEESNLGIRTEPEDTVPLENNQVTVEIGAVTDTSDIPNVNLSLEIQDMRSELIAATEEIKKNQKDTTEKLQSIEASISKLSNQKEPIDRSTVPTNNTTNVTLEKKFKLKHVFKNVNEFKEKVTNFSEKEDHFNVNWSIGVKRHFNPWLGFYVYCEPIAPPSDKWSIRTRLELRVVGPHQDGVSKTCERFYEKSGGLGIFKFLNWEEMKLWYLVDGNLTVEATVTIIEMTGFEKKEIRKFDESQKDVSDVILVFLASQSSVFKALLLGNFSESQQSEVALNGSDPNDFQGFLEVLYGEKGIDDTNVEAVALLADMYNAQTVTRKCDEFLLKESKKPFLQKRDIATRYHLEKSEKQCNDGLRTLENLFFYFPIDITSSDHQTKFGLFKMLFCVFICFYYSNMLTTFFSIFRFREKAFNEMGNIGNEPGSHLELENAPVLQKMTHKSNEENQQLSDRLQSIEASISKILKLNEVAEKSEKDSNANYNTSNTAPEKIIKLNRVFKNANEFEKEVYHYSDEKDNFNVNCYLKVRRHEDHLGFFIHCEPFAPADEWSIRTKLEYKIVGPNQNDLIRTWDYCYDHAEGWGWQKFLNWEIIKDWYMVDGSLTVEAKYLASQSSVFKALLLGGFSESKQSEVTLHGIDPDDFQGFLEVLYGEPGIDDSNVEGVALLADMYHAPIVIRKCEEFLLKESKKTLEKKQEIATRYHLKTVEEKK
ncbi:hypothetical protein B9Z55_007694 [Caenorhabditis nigoni]|uniref:BTB domain-containing protein n=1 Tax=Caenorhabditis nigoni TaxID=1611254 RepID=A0A2G5VAT9_9PELO|nr:hypothetical protein B9Z55_007694 [Caenorhabditis nigoni]